MNEMYPNMRIMTAKRREWESVYVPLIGQKYSNMRCNLSNDIRSQYFGTFLFFFHIIITLSLIQNIQFLFIYNTDDKDRKKVNPDKLRHGVQEFESENDKEILYMFLAKYVRKTHADSEQRYVVS